MIELNRIYNEDCLEGMKRMPDKSVQLILTDIPYGEVSKNGEERAKYGGQLRKLDKGMADIEQFDLESFLNECYRVCKGSVYIFCGIEQISSVFSFFKEKKDMMVRQCGWKKTNPSPQNGQHMWLSSFENCIFAKFRKTNFNESCKSAIWEYPVGRSKVHPTEKPLSLFEKLVLASSNEGDSVLDPCIGSGTTAIACINTNRNYIGFELDKHYCDIANERVQKAMQDKAASGKGL